MKCFSGWVVLILMVIHSPVLANEFSGNIAVQYQFYVNEALFAEQERNSASISLEPEYYHQWDSGNSLTIVPFARLDSADSERSHADIREFKYIWLGDDYELHLGVGKVFWGVTEFVHLVDIINQTDAVESFDGEEKLGQPMVQLSLSRQWGILDAFVLPYFRERTFPGLDGRLRSRVVVDTDNARYESSDEQRHIDFALRYSNSISRAVAKWDYGVYYFKGTSREPTLLLDTAEDGTEVYIPFYEQIDQAGLDISLVLGEWLCKAEAIYRRGMTEDYFAAVGGFEYTIVGIFESRMDLGIITEYAYDERGDDAPTPLENDVMFGFRLGLNNTASTEILLGAIKDMDSSALYLTVEASHRLGNHWKLKMEGALFDMPREDPLYDLREDSYLQLELAYHF